MSYQHLPGTERQSAILGAALDCVISIDARGRVTYFNAAAERTFGYRADEVIGREMAELIVPPALRDAHRRGLERHLATGKRRVLDRRIELTAMRADGSEFPAELTVTRVDISSEEPAFTGYVRDVTERVQAQSDLVGARERLAAVADEQAALRRVATLIAEEATPAEVFAAVAKEVARILEVPLISVVRLDGDVAIQVGAFGKGNPVPVGTSWPLDDHGVLGRVSRTGEPARIDYAEVPDLLERLVRDSAIRCAAGVPITVEGGLWGVMVALSTDRAGLPERLEERLAAFTELVGTAIANTHARDELRRLADDQSALRRVATLVAEDAPPQQVFDAVCEEAGRLIGAKVVNLAHFTADGFSLTMAGWSLDDNHVPPGTRLPLEGETAVVIVQRTCAPARVTSYEGVEGELAQLLRTLGINAQVAAPVVVQGRVWGALVAGADTHELLGDGVESRIASFAELIGITVSNTIARSELLAARRRAIEAGDAARGRLTRDLHDGAQQGLVNVLINLQLAQDKWADDQPVARKLLDRAATEVQASIDELRDLATGIHPEILTNRGLAAAVESLAERLPLPVTTAGLPELRLPKEVEASIYFFVSEALTNVVKHAQASSARVEASLEVERLTIEVGDDGVGGVQATATGSGLVGLRDRIAALDGTLTIESEPRGGTTLHAVLPLEGGSVG